MEREIMIDRIMDFFNNMPKYNWLNKKELLRILNTVEDKDLEDYIDKYNLK